MIRILIADDHHLVRQGIKSLLEKEPDIVIVGEARDGLETLAYVSQLHPDVVILDINMPHLTGIEVINDIHAAGIQTAVIILSMYSDESIVKRALRNGASGYLLKNSISDDLVAAIRAVHRQEFFLSPELESYFNPGELTKIHTLLEFDITTEALTDREREICRLIAQGLTNQAISKSLDISTKTVEKHRANLMAKLHVQDLASLIREAIRQGIIFLEE
jgi:DNA-binding NarL/FixJ family response regulator